MKMNFQSNLYTVWAGRVYSFTIHSAIWLNFRTFSLFFLAHWKISLGEEKRTDTRKKFGDAEFRDLGIVAVVYFRNWKSEFSCCSLRDRQLFLERAHIEHFPHTHIHIHRNGHFVIISFLHIFEFDEILNTIEIRFEAQILDSELL